MSETAVETQASEDEATSLVEDVVVEEDVVVDSATEEVVESEDWRSNIADEKVRKFADQFASPADAVRASLEFRQKLSNAIHVPTEGADEEEVSKFRKAIGVPDEPEGYEIKAPEGLSEEFKPANDVKMQEFAAKMWEAGASKDVVSAATEWYYNLLEETETAADKQFQQSIEEGTTALRKEWGSDFDRNMEGANRVFKMFGDEEAEAVLAGAKYEGVPAGNHPAFLRMFATLWKRVGEEGFQSAMTEDERASTEEKLSELTRQAHEANAKGDRAAADKFFRQRSELSAKYYQE